MSTKGKSFICLFEYAVAPPQWLTGSVRPGAGCRDSTPVNTGCAVRSHDS